MNLNLQYKAIQYYLPSMKIVTIFVLILAIRLSDGCHPCYNANTQNCQSPPKLPTTLHMSVHPHLDAYWIFNFESYYDPQPTEGEVRGYFASNRFHSVKDIFNTARDVLWQSKKYRQTNNNHSQFGHRTFMNSEMGFFKRWYNSIGATEKEQVKQLLKTKYWEILGGGWVQHDQGCAYYDDIIENFQVGLAFLKDQFNYHPKIAISADSFGHSQTTLAILAHIGIQGFFVERSDEHILLKNRTEFLWKAKSGNNQFYGALPTHIRWAIHGFEDQFIGGSINEQVCQAKGTYLQNMRGQNEFLKRILKSSHIMRYFGHDFQRFDNYSYTVIQKFMEQFSRQKCPGVTATYSNPTEYFQALFGQVWADKVKEIHVREEDIMPIWDYDSGLYWTGYYTTDQYNKKNYRDAGRFLHAIRKLYLPLYITDPKSSKHVQTYQTLEELAEQVAYLQHHDGISGTSKYMVMDTLYKQNQKLIDKLKKEVLEFVFEDEFSLGSEGQVGLICMSGTQECKIPNGLGNQDVLIKVLNTDAGVSGDAAGYHRQVIVQLPQSTLYTADCDYEINCFCFEDQCPCKMYLYPTLFTYTAIRLKKSAERPTNKINKLTSFTKSQDASFNESHFTLTHESKSYSITYMRVEATPTPRNYDHLSRYGTQSPRGFTVRPGKYALGNDPSTARVWAGIENVYQLDAKKSKFYLIKWKRQGMKTLITISKDKPNEWKVQTLTAAQSLHLSDLYLQVSSPIKNGKTFYTDSNGWLTLPRTLNHHADYEAYFSPAGYDDIDGNTYPCTAFTFIQDQDDKLSVNLDRPQGVIGRGEGKIWINFERLSSDDGKWVYQSAIRNEYQKWTHTITVQNHNYNERVIQRLYDQPYFVQINSIAPNDQIGDINVNQKVRNSWTALSHLPQLKFFVKPLNRSGQVILRVHNMDDEKTVETALFAGQVNVLLTSYYGKIVRESKIQETSLGANMKYEDFIKQKWNWNKVINLTKENSIFTKSFGENITLRPLQIRTFLLTNVTVSEPCVEVTELKHSGSSTKYTLDLNKPMPKRASDVKERQKQIREWGLNGDHCNADGPVLNEKGGQRNEEKGTIEKVKQFMGITAEKTEQPIQIKKPQDFRQAQNTKRPSHPVKPHPKPSKIPTQPVAPLSQVQIPKAPLSDSQAFALLKTKVMNAQRMTLQEKGAYFRAKLEQIRKFKAQMAIVVNP